MARPKLQGKVAGQLLRRIAGEDWPKGGGDQLPPMRQLAAQLRISPTTLAAAIRQLAGQGLFEMRPRKRIRLVAGAAELARRLLKPPPKPPEPRRLAILTMDYIRPMGKIPFYQMIVDQIITEARKRGLEATLVWWSGKESQVEVDELLRSRYDGAVCIGFGHAPTTSLVLLHGAGFPLVFMNTQIPGIRSPAVVFDLFHATQRIAEELRKLGHRNLCLMADPLNIGELDGVPAGSGVSLGWMTYLQEQGLLPTCTLPLYLPWRLNNKVVYDRGFRLIMASSERPTAIVFLFSIWAGAFLSDPEFSRLEVPEQLSLALLEIPTGLPTVPHRPPLTYLEINFTRTAQCLVETFEKLLNGESNPPIIRVALDRTLTESIGPPPARPAPA